MTEYAEIHRWSWIFVEYAVAQTSPRQEPVTVRASLTVLPFATPQECVAILVTWVAAQRINHDASQARRGIFVIPVAVTVELVPQHGPQRHRVYLNGCLATSLHLQFHLYLLSMQPCSTRIEALSTSVDACVQNETYRFAA